MDTDRVIPVPLSAADREVAALRTRLAALAEILDAITTHRWIIAATYQGTALGYQVNVRDEPSRSAEATTYSAMPSTFAPSPIEAGLKGLDAVPLFVSPDEDGMEARAMKASADCLADLERLRLVERLGEELRASFPGKTSYSADEVTALLAGFSRLSAAAVATRRQNDAWLRFCVQADAIFTNVACVDESAGDAIGDWLAHYRAAVDRAFAGLPSAAVPAMDSLEALLAGAAHG